MKYDCLPTYVKDFLPSYIPTYMFMWEEFTALRFTPLEPAVYAILAPQNDEYKIVYIGVSKKIRNRLKNHTIKRVAEEVYMGTYGIKICYTTVQLDSKDYNSLELKMIKKYKPEFNRNNKY